MKFFLFYITFLITIHVGLAQETYKQVRLDTIKIEQKKFDEVSLKKYENDKDFNYNVEKKEDSIFEELWSWLGRMVKKVLSWMFDDISPAVGLIKDFLSILPYILLIVLLYFILKFFLKVNTRNLINGNTKVPNINMSADEELIQNANLEELIQQSITNKDFRLAVRYYYLLILKELSAQEIINWQQEKTNEDYLKELKESKFFKDFSTTTKLYDFVWYGNFDIAESDFNKAQAIFSDLKAQING